MGIWTPIATADGAATTLAADIASGDLTLTAADPASLPPSGSYIYALIGSEWIKVTGAAANPFTIQRALFGSTAAAHGSGDDITLLVVPQTIIDMIAENAPAAPVQSVAGKTGAVTLTKSDVGLGSVDNTADSAKPVSTAQQSALDGKVAKAGDTMTGPLNVTSAGVDIGYIYGDPVTGITVVNDPAFSDGYLFMGTGGGASLGTSLFGLDLSLYGSSIGVSGPLAGQCFARWPGPASLAANLLLTTGLPSLVVVTTAGSGKAKLPVLTTGDYYEFCIVNRTGSGITAAVQTGNTIEAFAGDTLDGSDGVVIPAHTAMAFAFYGQGADKIWMRTA